MSTDAHPFADAESYLFELFDVGRIRPYRHAVMALAHREDLAEEELHKHYLGGVAGTWESYRLIRISHWDERAGRWVGHVVHDGERVVNPALLEAAER